MLKPNFKLNTVSSTGNYAEIHVEPLEKGLGHTLGNAMRRVLLTNLEGAAATSISIDGINHQFTTLSGLQEDIVQFVLGFKTVAFKLDTEGPVEVTLDIKGKKEVTARDINCPAGVSVANPDQYLGTLTSDKAKIKATITVDKGIGYVPSEEHGTPEIGVIPLDSIFTPVVKAHYTVEATRVGRQTDLDRIKFFIETNGTITPEESLRKAASILVDFFNQVVNPVFADVAEGGSIAANISDAVLEDLDLPVRVINALKKAGYKKVSDFAVLEKADLIKVKNLGEKSVQDIINQLASRGVEIK
jgi:DNA-directed RNA polymerase subunit alpha